MKLLSEYSGPEQSALRTEVCRDAPDDKSNYYLRVCEANEIDPFSGLLYLTKRVSQGKDRWSVSPSVDGSRLKASRTGQYAGSDEPEFDSEDKPNPVWCRVTVYREIKGERYAFTAKCRWAEFKAAPPNDFMWKSKPYHMLSKVTEVQALRKAFPDAVPASGEDENDTVVSDDHVPDQPKIDPKLMVEWNNAVQALKAYGKDENDLYVYLKIGNLAFLTKEMMDQLHSWYTELQREASVHGVIRNAARDEIPLPDSP